MITLYLAEHNITKKKYFGKTTRYHSIEELQKRYHGSGTNWNKHLKEFSDDVTMKILYSSEDIELIKSLALCYSRFWNIVKSKDYSNMKLENGIDGWQSGGTPHNKGIKGLIKHSDKVNKSKGRSGTLNGHSKTWLIFDKYDNIVHTVYGDIFGYCLLNNLPSKALYKSYQNNGKAIYKSQPWQTPKEYKIYSGWYMKTKPKLV